MCSRMYCARGAHASADVNRGGSNRSLSVRYWGAAATSVATTTNDSNKWLAIRPLSYNPAMPNAPLVDAQSLTKWYGAIRAVSDVSFSLAPGEVLGYLGPNGSGKSTTVGLVTGLIEPSGGRVLFRGADISEDPIEYRRHVGYVPEEPHLYPYLSGLEYLQL